MFVAAGEALAGDPELRAEINQGLVAVLRSVVAEQKSGVSTFISDQVKSWDMGQLISLIEINIGRDLQYIRFNGSLIGGLAGLALYTLEYLLRLAVTNSSRPVLLVVAMSWQCACLKAENRFPSFLRTIVALRNDSTRFASSH